jgi:N-glycosylase/DNA lyase
MEIIQDQNHISLKNITNFDLSQTFDCGQCFRWEKSDGKFHGVVQGKSITLSQNGNNILIENMSVSEFKSFWFDYFDLGTDYEKIGENVARVSVIASDAYHACSGIRILKQDPWETLCSFIISQNNNIPRIKKIVSSLCSIFGKKIGNDFSFPSAEKISSLDLDDLSPIKSGFRAKYILDAANKVENKEIVFKILSSSTIDDARNALMQIKGVGPKVADCVLLYGLHKLEAFPMDVWMKRVMKTFFQNKSPQIFGPYAGIAQQY